MELILFIDGLTADYKCVAHDTGVSDNVRRGAGRARGEQPRPGGAQCENDGHTGET